jgi:hypothetical protein
MNKKLKIALIRRYSEQGFAMPIAMGLGLIMVLIAATMIMRSQGDQATASVQKSTAQSLSVAETGITRVQTFLNKNRGFANQSYPWTSYLANLANSCTSGTLYDEAAAFNNWTSVGSGTGQFKVISYIPTTTEGVLVLEGQALQGSNVKSTTRLQVKIPLDRSAIPSFSPPGAWAQKFGLGNNRITGDVIDAGCPPGSLDSDERSQISGNIVTDPGLTLPPALPIPTICTGFLVYPTTCGAMRLDAIKDDLALPRTTTPADTSNANGEYIYYVAKDSSGKSIELSGTKKLVITPGKKVTLYLEGNIDTNGSGVKIGHNCYDSTTAPDGEPDDNNKDGTVGNSGDKVTGCEPTNFQIFGGTGTTSIVLGGSNTIDAFIFAPNAVHSGVNGSAEIRGSIWLKEWDRANGKHNVISQIASWNNIPPILRPSRPAPLNSWQQQETP